MALAGASYLDGIGCGWNLVHYAAQQAHATEADGNGRRGQRPAGGKTCDTPARGAIRSSCPKPKLWGQTANRCSSRLAAAAAAAASPCCCQILLTVASCVEDINRTVC